MPTPNCVACGKAAYPLESVQATNGWYHKLCFKCNTCKTTLNLKNYKFAQGQVWCATHTPKVTSTATGLDSVAMKSALNAPKKKAEGLSVAHKGAKELAPKSSGDFSVNDPNRDQSTENAPEQSNIQYEQHSGDQSTENNPDQSNIQYEQANPDQSTENNPEQYQ